MCKNEYIQVLWVENDPKITPTYPREAEMVAGIELHPFSCWEEAAVELERDYDRWDAIILDAKCCYRKDDADKADRFLSNVLPRIEKLANRKKRAIFWYVLSGQGEDDIRDNIPDTNYWDEDWFRKTNRRFYSKSGKITWGEKEIPERQALFERIRAHVTRYSHDIQVKQNLYPDVFKALARLEKLGLSGDVYAKLMQLIEPIHFGDTSNSDYNRRYVDLRKSLEHIFRHMVEMGILPPIIIDEIQKEKDSVNLSWSSLFLGGRTLDSKLSEKVTRQTDDPILPKQLSPWLKEAVFQSGGAVHTSAKENKVATSLEKYLPLVGDSPYMLRSLTMGLCDFILWYDDFCEKHPDANKNAEEFWILKE